MTPVEPCYNPNVGYWSSWHCDGVSTFKNKKITQIGISASLRVENKNNHASWSSGLFVIKITNI